MKNNDIVLRPDIFYKWVDGKKQRRDFQYVLGLNILDKPFQQHGSCVEGGLYFCDFEYLCDHWDENDEFIVILSYVILGNVYPVVEDPTREDTIRGHSCQVI